MAQSTAEVTVGTGDLYVGDAEGQTKPTIGTAPTTGYTHLGYTEGGVTFAVDRTFEDVFVAEEFDPVKIMKTAQSVRILAELAQPSLDNIAAAIGGTVVTDTYTPPASTVLPAAKALCLYMVNGKVGDNTKDRLYYIYSAIPVGAFQIVHAKAPQKQMISVEFRAQKVTGQDIFIIDEET